MAHPSPPPPPNKAGWAFTVNCSGIIIYIHKTKMKCPFEHIGRSTTRAIYSLYISTYTNEPIV